MEDLLLGAHIAAGAGGLVVGPVAMVAGKRRGAHTRAGHAYQAAVTVLAVTAVGLAAFSWSQLWWLALIGIATQAAAGGGWLLARRRPLGWVSWHVQLMCGSYVSFVTGFLVVNWSSPVAWLLPTLVASPLIARATTRAIGAATPV